MIYVNSFDGKYVAWIWEQEVNEEECSWGLLSSRKLIETHKFFYSGPSMLLKKMKIKGNTFFFIYCYSWLSSTSIIQGDSGRMEPSENFQNDSERYSSLFFSYKHLFYTIRDCSKLLILHKNREDFSFWRQFPVYYGLF